jgi:hypothetical protein
MKIKKPDIEPEEVVKDIRHNLPVEFFKNLVRSLYPPSYKELALKTMKAAFSYLFWIILFSYALMLIGAIPVAYNLKSGISDALSSFDSIVVNATAEMNKEFYIPQLGAGIDTREGINTTAEKLLVTAEDIKLQKWYCSIIPVCGLVREPYNSISLQTLADPLNHKETFTALIIGLLLFLLPSILATILVFVLIKYLLVSVLFWMFGLLFTKLINRKIRSARVYKAAIFSLTPMIMLETVNIPYGRDFFYLPVLVSLLLFFIGLLFASERGSKSY